MRTKKHTLAALLAAAGMALSSATMAQSMQDRGWYAGASIGQSEVQDFCDGIPGCDGKDSAWKIFGGYQVNRNFAIELGYTDLGEATVNVSGPGGNLNASVESSAWELVGIGSLPVANRFSVYGKLGLYRGEVEGRGAGTVLGVPVNFNEDDSGTDLTFGIGAKFDLTRNLALRGEWQRYNDFSGADIDVLSVGLVVRF